MTTRTPRAVPILAALLLGASAAPALTLAASAATTVSAQADDATEDPVIAACPIDGDHELIDSWGWRRSGGRRHQGIDITAARGTELYAAADGWANMKRSNLGGNAIWLTTDDGDEFYYAHLDAFEGDDRMVAAGELIGYVGSTGNAGGAHLHFEVHPGGQVENPYEHVVAACAGQRAPASAEARIPNLTGSSIDRLVSRLRADRARSISTQHLLVL